MKMKYYLLRDETPDLIGPFETLGEAKDHRGDSDLKGFTVVRVRYDLSDHFSKSYRTAAERHTIYPTGG